MIFIDTCLKRRYRCALFSIILECVLLLLTIHISITLLYHSIRLHVYVVNFCAYLFAYFGKNVHPNGKLPLVIRKITRKFISYRQIHI